MSGTSFIHPDAPPSAILSDGIVTIPLYAVSTVTLNESYHLPPLGASGMYTAVGTHDDTINLSGLLLGEDRFGLKFALERMAEPLWSSSPLAQLTGGNASGLVLITSLTVRTDLLVDALNFTASAARRDVIDVTIALRQMDRPKVRARNLEAANLAVRALADFGGR